jgi:hypothetical protein
MAIPRETPFIVSPTPEKTFGSVWLRNINIHCPQINAEGNTDGHITIELVPYSSEGSEAIYNPEAGKSFWDSVNEVPEVAAAMSAIIAAVAPLRTWIEAQNDESEE